MEDTLKKLTDKIYHEGINKAKAEAEEIIETANKQAEDIISNAQKEAEDIISKANKDSDDYRNKVHSELEISSQQSIAKVKQSLADELLTLMVDKPVEKAFNDEEFIKDMIKTVLSNWDKNAENNDVEVLYPDNDKLNSFIKDAFGDIVNKGFKFYPSKDLENGFVVKSNNDGYQISFTEESFISFIKEYIRPRTYELLFK